MENRRRPQLQRIDLPRDPEGIGDEELQQPPRRDREDDDFPQGDAPDRAVGFRRPEVRREDLRKADQEPHADRRGEPFERPDPAGLLHLREDPEQARADRHPDREDVAAQEVEAEEEPEGDQTSARPFPSPDKGPEDPGEEHHPRVVVRVEDLGDPDTGEDVGHRADPGRGRRRRERSEERHHPQPRERPVQHRVELHRVLVGEEPEQHASRIERARVRVGQERPPARDPADPHREPAARVRVVDRVLDRQVVADQVPPAEHLPDEERIDVDGEDEEHEERSRKDAPQRRRAGCRLVVQRRKDRPSQRGRDSLCAGGMA